MITDVLIMIYALAMAILVYQAEKFQYHSIKIIIYGIFLTPIAGFALLNYYSRQLRKATS